MSLLRSADEIVAGVDNLASLPAVYQRVKVIIDDQSSSVADLAEVLTTDAGLAARLLRVVNSVYFGLMSRVDTVTRAVSLLGMQQVHDLVLATSVSNMFKGISPGNMNMTRYWSNSVMCALVARAAADTERQGDLERHFVAGLLADIGHLVLYRVEPALAEKASLIAQRDGLPLHRLERELIGCDHAQVGAALIKKWALPARLGQAIAGQLSPSQVEAEYRHDAAIVHIGRTLTIALENQLDEAGIVAAMDPSVWTLTRVAPLNMAEMDHGEVVALYFPSAG
jgi:HD-like signal output (HDOD) protein